MTDLTRRKKELLNSYNNLCSCYGDIISEQTKINQQLKELLKECKIPINLLIRMNIDGINGYKLLDLLIKIDNAIGEKK